MAYKVLWSKKAEKELSKIDKTQAKLLYSWVEKNLDDCINPRKFGRPLTEEWQGFWRYDIGKYRIICDLQDESVIILVVKIGHRREVYRKH